jgi:hypothetical protein
MSCRRAFEVDLAGFLLDPRAEEFASFRDHYPRCPECSSEVGVWTQLEQQLQGGEAERSRTVWIENTHPDPVALDHYEQGVGLSDTERSRLESHISACASCRDELQALRSFQPEQLQAPEARAASSLGRAQSDGQAPEARAASSLGRAQSDTSFLDKLRRLAWNPGFAYALLALVLGPAIYMTLDSTPLVQGRSDRDVLSEADTIRAPAFAPPPAEDKAEQEMEMAKEVPAQAMRKAAQPPRSEPLGASAVEGKAAQPPRSEPLGASAVEGKAAQPPRSEPLGASAVEELARNTQAAEKQELRVASEAPVARSRAARPAEPSVPVDRAQTDQQAPVMEMSMDTMQAAPKAGRTMAYSAVSGAVRLRAGTLVNVAESLARAGFRLSAPLPPGLASEHAEIRLVDATGRRELRERSGARAAADVDLQVPAGWLEAGFYSVGIHDIRADALDVPRAVFRLRVGGP